MKITVESKYDIGDTVRFEILLSTKCTLRGASKIINVRFCDGIEYLIGYNDGERKWIKESDVYGLESEGKQ